MSPLLANIYMRRFLKAWEGEATTDDSAVASSTTPTTS